MRSAEDIIVTYCGDIEERIQACRTKDAALLLKTRLCGELREHCKSEMIFNVLDQNADRLIDETFDETGRNKRLREE